MGGDDIVVEYVLISFLDVISNLFGVGMRLVVVLVGVNADVDAMSIDKDERNVMSFMIFDDEF